MFKGLFLSIWELARTRGLQLILLIMQKSCAGLKAETKFLQVLNLVEMVDVLENTIYCPLSVTNGSIAVPDLAVILVVV